jgi:hypothetical protein
LITFSAILLSLLGSFSSNIMKRRSNLDRRESGIPIFLATDYSLEVETGDRFSSSYYATSGVETSMDT